MANRTPNLDLALDFMGHVPTEQALVENFKKIDDFAGEGGGGGTAPDTEGTASAPRARDSWRDGATATKSVGVQFIFLYDASVEVGDMYPQADPMIVAEGGKVTYEFEGKNVDFGYLKTCYNRDVPGAPAYDEGVLMFGNVDGESVVSAGEITEGAAYLTSGGDIKGGAFTTQSLLQVISDLRDRIEALETAAG